MSQVRTRFDDKIQNLQTRLLEMGVTAEEMVRDAVTALVRHDRRLAASVIGRDDEIDSMDQEIEGACLCLVALQQPMGSDLRRISAMLKSVTDIERIADHAVDIARTVRNAGIEFPYQPLVDIPRLAEAVSGMLHDALHALAAHDLEKVGRVIDADDDVDRLYAWMKRDLDVAMKADPATVVPASRLLFVAHYLERIADHAVSIARGVHFIENGWSERANHTSAAA